MPKSLMSLTISALDEFNHIANLQQLLEICLEEFDYPTEKTQFRVDLLISLYLPKVELHPEELKFSLERIRQQLSTDSAQE
jgi:hypothetical protein